MIGYFLNARRSSKTLLSLALLAPLSLAPVIANESLEQLKGLDIEDLVDVEVTTVSRQPQKLIGAASAIEVVSDDDIQRHGAFNLPDALELSVGLQVAREDARTWAISARGFNITTANKMQVMLDGRRLYTPLYSGIFWDAQNTLMHDIDRIEIVRGPGATLWGSNAVNGVINIITKEAQETQGWLAHLGAGNHHQAFGSLRYGGRIAPTTHYRVYAKFETDDELPTFGDVTPAEDRSFAQAGFRIDSYLGSDNRITLQGDIYDGEHGIRDSDDGTLSGHNVIARWNHILNADSDVTLQLYYDQTRREIPDVFLEDRDTIDVEFQQLWEGPRDSKLVWGANYHYSNSVIQNSDRVQFIPPERNTHSYGAFAQYQAYLIPEKLGAIIGAKFENNTLGDSEFQPNVRLFWRPNDNATVWGSVASATRKPTQIDTDFHLFRPEGVLAFQGSPDFESEEVIAYELGYRAQLLRNLSLDLALFRNDYDHLRSLEPDPETVLPFTFDNLLEARSHGAEAILNYQVTESWTVQAGAVFLDTDFSPKEGSADPNPGVVEGNDPDHWFRLRSTIEFAPGWQFAAQIRYTDELPNPAVPSHTDLDLRLGWQTTDSFGLSLVGQNLLDPEHPEFDEQEPDSAQVPRHVYATATWRF